MKKLGFSMLLLSVALILGGTAFAAPPPLAGDNSRYFTTYYSNANAANAPDATVRIVNDGNSGANQYANIYVFDDSEELTECCSCVVTPDGLLSESVNNNLTANPLTGIKPTRGVIKVIASDVSGGNIGVPVFGLRGSATHIQGTKVTLSPGTQLSLW